MKYLISLLFDPHVIEINLIPCQSHVYIRVFVQKLMKMLYFHYTHKNTCQIVQLTILHKISQLVLRFVVSAIVHSID